MVYNGQLLIMKKKSIWIVALVAIVAITTFSAFTFGTAEGQSDSKLGNSIKTDTQFFRMDWSGNAYKYYDKVATISISSNGRFRINDLQNDEVITGTYVIMGESLNNQYDSSTISFNTSDGEFNGTITRISYERRFTIQVNGLLFR